MNFSSIPLVPGDPDGPLRVLIIGRISTERQNEENIEASYRSVEQYLRQIYHGPLEIIHLGEQASGLLTDRATIRQAEELMDAGDIDLVISEDLSRIYRNPRHQYDFVQNAVDRNIRLICIGDHLDTADENWEVMMGAASLRHGLHIPDTRRRIRRTAIHAFHRGGMVSKIKFGYRRLSKEEAESARFGPKGLRIAKDASLTPVILELSSRYRQGTSVSALADWLNDREISPGPYVEKGTWTGRLVKALLADPILCGRRTFRNTVCQPIFRTGKYRQVPNLEPEIELIPELAHLSEDEHRAILAEMKLGSPKRNETRSKRRNRHRRLNVPRKRSLWPGQAMTCAICGSLFYYTGRYLKCRNA